MAYCADPLTLRDSGPSRSCCALIARRASFQKRTNTSKAIARKVGLVNSSLGRTDSRSPASNPPLPQNQPLTQAAAPHRIDALRLRFPVVIPRAASRASGLNGAGGEMHARELGAPVRHAGRQREAGYILRTFGHYVLPSTAGRSTTAPGRRRSVMRGRACRWVPCLTGPPRGYRCAVR